MRAALAPAVGGPEVVEVTDVDPPELGPGQARVRAQILAQIHQRVVHQLTGANRPFVVGLERMQVVGPDARGDGDDVGVGWRLWTQAAAEKCKMQNAKCK